jgi:hypothetical protein
VRHVGHLPRMQMWLLLAIKEEISTKCWLTFLKIDHLFQMFVSRNGSGKHTHTHTHTIMSKLFCLLACYALTLTENARVSQNVGLTLWPTNVRNEFYSIQYCNPEAYDSNPDNRKRFNKVITFFFGGWQLDPGFFRFTGMLRSFSVLRVTL